MQALICANGPFPNEIIFRRLLDNCNLIICADGGANRIVERGIVPDFVVGDLDSIVPKTRERIPAANLIEAPSQYATDLEKTFQYAVEKGVQNAWVIGVTGERPDHQICNFAMIEKFCRQIDLKTVDEWGIGRFVFDEAVFSGEVGQQVSLHSFRKTNGVTTSGLKYPLKNETLEWAVRDGQSNEIASNPVRISVKNGNLFVFIAFGRHVDKTLIGSMLA